MLDGERTGEVFCSVNLTAITLDLMDAVNVYFPDALKDPDLMVKLGESQHTVAGLDSVRASMDAVLEAEAWGAQIDYGAKDLHAYITGPAFNDPDSFEIPSNLFELGRFPIHFEATSMLRNKYLDKGTVPIYALLMGPITILGFLFKLEGAMRWAIKEPSLFQSLLEQISDMVVQYANLLIESGADALTVADPTASLNMISPRTFKKFLMPVYKKLSEQIEGHVILHICGDTTPILEDILETGFSGFSFEGPTNKVKVVKEVMGDRMALYGNIPTYDILMTGTVEDVKKAVMEACADGIDSIVPACTTPLQTPLRNQKAMAEAVREYNKSKGFN
jgi:[methyl-Co(III) methanol-specific corrinoid protein]:coenzyme M methyltransferase